MKMRMEKCLLLGGPHDGTRIEIDTGRQWIRMPEPVATSADLYASTQMASEDIIYSREILRSADRRFHVYIAADVNAEDAIERLIEGYRRPAAN